MLEHFDDLLEDLSGLMHDSVEILSVTPGNPDPDTLETGAPTKTITWTGKGSLQPNRRRPAPANITGGVAEEQPEFLLYVPLKALSRDNGFVPRVNGREYRLVRPAQNVGGQGGYWLLGVSGNR